MEPNQEALNLGRIASQTLLFPMQPQKLTEDELQAIAGAHFGWDALGGHLYPRMLQISERFGGHRVDAAMRAKVQTWLQGWVQPPDYYQIHHPLYASGQWWRIFRTAMFVEKDLAEAHDASRSISREQLEGRYLHVLGQGARERYESHEAWWQAVLGTIRMGSWHVALYSPRYQAFISPFVLDGQGEEGAIQDLRAEWSKPTFRLYSTEPTSAAGFGVFDLGRMIASGAYVELLGDLQAAPPFGETWGPGVADPRHGGTAGWKVTGVIHVFQDNQGVDQRRVYRLMDAPEVDGIALDGADPFRLVQSLHAVTGWLPKGVPAELMAPDRLEDLVKVAPPSLGGPTGDTPLLVPKEAFWDALSVHPALVPVYGRVISLSPEK